MDLLDPTTVVKFIPDEQLSFRPGWLASTETCPCLTYILVVVESSWAPTSETEKKIPIENQFDTFRDFDPQKVIILFFSLQKVGNSIPKIPICRGRSPL